MRSIVRRMQATTLEATLAGLPELSTTPEVSALLRCRRQFVIELIRSGELEAVQRKRQQGSRLLIPKESLRRYLERSTR